MSKIIDSKTISKSNENGGKVSGYSVTKATGQGTFTGEVYICEEDIPYASDFLGYQLAERKCDIQEHQARAHKYEQRWIEAKHLAIVAKESGQSEDTIKFLEHQCNIAYRDACKEVNAYRFLRDNYKNHANQMVQARIDYFSKKNEASE